MLNHIVSAMFNAYTQVVVLFLLLAYFFARRHDPHMITSKLTLLRTVIMILLFIYFLWNWSSEIPPSLRNTSVLGMLIINLFFIKNLVLARWEKPYRDALEAYAREPENEEQLDRIWRAGRRLYYLRYLISSLFSGGSPKHFLHGITTERICNDLEEIIIREGKIEHLISYKKLVAFLEERLADDELTPPEDKNSIEQSIKQFAGNEWIEEGVDEFLNKLIESPVDFPHHKRHIWSRIFRSKAKKS
ncbi:MAG: hypothetical protein LJE63_03945 [Desulfobacteraceae bacterium]|jgi:hypothetical protein|nr:hypothetical protein [Desulfobacteraceae bacterium]